MEQVEVSGSRIDASSPMLTGELFAAQAAATPTAVAVVVGDVELTYGQVAERAARFGALLRAAGVGPESVVGVCLPREADLVPLLLGVWLAGGAYLPIDPALPGERIDYMLADSGAAVLVTVSGQAVDFAGTRIDLDTVVPDEVAPLPVPCAVVPEQLAYVLYTSGSTGRPKGVMIGHGALHNLLASIRDDLGAQGRTVWLASTSVSFDISGLELHLPLVTGGRVVLARDHEAKDPAALIALIGAHRVTHVQATPSAWRLLLEAGFDDWTVTALTGGEPLPAHLATRLIETTQRVVNVYGPTETTIWSSFWDVPEEPETIAVGHPLANTGLYVLDERLRQLPPGVTGQLFIDGDGVARGYHGRADLTAERFLPNPYGAAGSRLYATGDLARFLADGSLECLGRIDSQVKIRGYRIELGEIETVLSGLEQVRQAVVTVHDEALVAYVVPAGGRVDAGELRARLAETLPEYMVPGAFVTIDAVPLSNSGKVDHRALPAPDLDAFATGGYTAPRTPVEERLAAVWAEVLGLPRVGVEDSFFDLGGDSIRAVRLVGALRAAGYDITIPDVFQQRTITALAARIGDGTGHSLITAVQPFALIGDDDRTALPADVVDAYPLSQAQTGMLVELAAAQDSTLYHNLNSFRIAESIGYAAEELRRAVDILTERHEILRTSIALSGYAQPLQLVHASARIPLTTVDLRGLTADQAQDRAREYVRQERAAGFDLTAAPLLRIAAHIESDRAWHLTFSHSHTVTDGWTLNSLLMELLGVYQALCEGREPAIHEAPAVRYADYIAAEQASLADPADQAFWQQVVDEHSPLVLPGSWADQAGRAPVDRTVDYTDLEDGLRVLAGRAKTSLKSVLLAAHLKVLSALTPDEAFHTGVVYHGRLEAPGADRVLGMHLNTLPFPTTRGARTWRELVERTYATETAIWSHRRYPLPAVQRAAGGSGLLSTLFDYQDFHQVDSGKAAGGIGIDGGLDGGGNEFALMAIAGNGRLGLAAGAGALGSANLERLAALYRLVLESMAADPDGDALAVPLPETDRRLLADWQRRTELPVDACLHELFAARAARTPDAVALTSGSAHLTYAELDERANRIAHHLTALGARPDTVVGVSLERGPDLVPTLLGVLKSGAAYLPLDPSNPADRLAYMLADAKADLLVTHSALDELEFTGTRVFVDAHAAEIAARPATAPVTDVRPDNLIYVIYTSGSTGLPKGVSLTHANVARLFTTTREQLAFSADDVWALFHSYAFDVSVWEMWGALLHGARLVVVPPTVSRSPHDLIDLLVRERVSVLCQTPSAFRALSGLAEQDDPRVDRLALRTVIFAGERLDMAELRSWAARKGTERPALVNMYGPTEITVYATHHVITADEVATSHRSNIGHALGDLSIHLLDTAGHPVPVGVPGEMHIGGPGLARGYLDRPGLTAERFVPDPFGAPGSRLYRTGDLVLRLPDGAIDFLGRIDGQIKIRGYRVELGEIEAALAACAGVRQAVVTVRENAAGEKSLVGYVVTGTAGAGADTAALRAALAVTLPEYMVPAAFVALDALPLSNSGKLDRRALPAPDLDAFSTGGYTAPRTPVEERLAAVWAEVLGLSEVGVEDSFFDLGGDSIRAVRLVGALRAAGYDVSIRDVFDHRTVAALAATVGDGGASLITAVEPFALIAEEDRAALPTDVVDAYPLSQIQTGMLVELMTSGDRGLYHNLNSFRIPDAVPFDAAALRGALDLVAARHEILRTSLHLADFSRPLQLVHAAVTFPLAVHDLRGLTAEQAQDRADTYLREERAAGFDLTAAPLLRFAAHIESDRAWRLTFSHSHTVTDGWTLNSLLMELLDVYRALSEGREPAVHEEPAVRYADYIAAEQASLADPADQAFWQRIVDEHSPLALPAGWGGERGGQVSHQVPFADLEDGLRALAAEARTSVKSVLLAAHLKVLGSLTSEQAFHTGVVYHGRLEAPGADRVLGMHLNTLPFPATRGARTWRELVERTYATESAIWSHRRYPLPAIQRAADNTRDLITVLFDHHDFHQVDTDTVDVDGGINDGGTEFALNAIPSNGYFNLSGSTEYFTAANLERLGAMYRSVLEAMAADADGDARAAHLPADELSRLLDTWNTTVEQPAEDCVHELFTAQATRTPDAIALTSGSAHLTYAELDERANRIAHHLIALGAGPERIVGLSLERGPDLIPALLGILKSGAAYLPLDPANPADRLAYMLADAKADLLVTHSALDELEFTGTRVFVDTHADEINARPATAPVTGVRPDNQIYVIYTSGSTGLPKGVSLTHANVARHFAATRGQFGFRPGDVVTQSHAYSFDVSVWEMWAALLHGGRLVLVPSAVARSPHDFLDLMVEQQVTVLLQTPSAFSALAAAAKDGDPRLDRLALRLVAFGGERLEAAELQPWIARMGLDHPEPVNLYGPTETTMHCAYHRVGAEDLADPRRSVIGRPVGDLTIHLLDAAGRLVPTGVPGEIHVGGPGVARGYLDRPALTAERFVPDPFGPPGARLYATGDLARRLPDGSLDSLGRIDSQVKIRGHRVELGEIESALTAHPDIRDAVVTVHEPAPGVKRLIAYLVAAGPLDLTGLRARLGESLPEYMVPAGYVLLDRIPLTSSSKVDVRALPAPDAEAFDASEYVGPRTPAEERIAAIWADVLGLSQVGVRSSFFDLGGDSMRVVRLVGALRAAGFDITVPAVFEHRTVAALAATVGTGGESLITAVRPFALIGDGDRALLPADAVDAYPLSQVQTGMLVELLATAPGKQRSLYHNVNSFLIRDGQPFSLESLQGAVDTVAARHDILRTSMHLEGFDEPLQIVHATADYPVVLEDLRGLDQAERARLKGEFLTREQSRTFDLTVAPLLRVSALVESEDSWRLNFTYNHAISEGWSYNSLLMEVLDCYRALRDAGAPDAYEQPAVRYADFIAAEQTALADPATQAFWQQIVEEHTPLALPVGWAAEAGEATRRHLQVPFADLEDGLRALAARAKTSLKSVLLAAHLKVLSALTPDEAFHTGVVYHGRLEAPGADRVLGMHLNTLPFPASRGARTWRELVERTYATETAIWSHRRYPLPAIQRAAGNTRDLLTVLFEFLDFHQVDTEAVDVDGGVSDGINEFALNVIPTRGSVNFHVSAGVLSQASLERLGGLYRSVLEAMAADPEGDARVVPLSGAEVAVLSAPGREVVWSTVSAPEAFAARVVESPDAVAVVVGDVELTYGQVAERAARFGALLRAAGVGPESVVGVCLPREADLVPLLHGVWLAGGAYLPIDPALPGERIDYMLADSGAAVLVTVSGRSVEFAGTRIDLDTVVLDEVPPVPASGAVVPEQLAYVLYTSGSTGRPKGVMIGHGALHNLLASVRDDLGVPDGSVWLASTSVSFDISGLELHLPLVTGGRVVLARDHEAKDPAALIALIGAHRVSHVQATPSAWRLLLEAGFEERSVTALTGGEPLPGHLASALSAVTRRVVNVYGPTETTIWSSFWEVPTGAGAVSIGHPLANTGLYVLDEGLRLLPSGVTGQLFIDGDGVARGYHGRADLTAERFLPNPYGAAGSRLYATGDLARFLADGSLECLGRIDSQVKVRGYRIELGEIETVLSGLEQVRQAVVTVHDEALVAYVVPAGGRVDAGELRARLAETLPEYMVPGAFVAIDAVPLSNSGKVDHRALPAPDLDAFATGGYTAPRTPVEERLAAVWAEVLGLPRVGVEDSFFDLGGDSIRAVRLVGALRAAGYDITIPDVFQQRTIAALAARIGDGTGESLITAVEPFALIGDDDRAALPADVVDAYPLSQVQTGMLVELLGSGDRGLYHNLNSFRIPDTAPFDAAALRGALDLVTARHEILRTSLHLADFSQPLQSVHATAEVPLTVHDLRGLTEAEVAERTTAYVEQERAAGFDLAAAPLLRIAVHIESDQAWRVTTSHSHTVTDGWTLNSLLMELLEVYRALRDGREPAVHEAPAVRYADYIAAEQTALSDPQTQAFWQHLVDTHSPLALPVSWADPATPGTPVGRIVHYGDLEDGLRRLATEARTSLKSVLLAAHLKVMGSLTAEDAFHTGVVYHGRLEAPGADRVLGMHLNTLPFPTTRGARTWRELVEQTYATETAIWSHRRYPLPAVQRAAGSSGDLVSILFEYLDFHVVDENSVDLDGSMGDGANEFALNVLARRDHLTLAGTSAAVDRSRLALLGERYRLVLEAMAADPNGDATLSHLPKAERAQLTTWAAGDPVEWPQGLTVDLIEAQAAATPDAVAVIAGDVRLTYREVDERANRIAHHLLTLGAG
ncbi:amino acid adenylation domain-containing protein, partial [Kitasatospora sp. NPDC001603]|uniref:amino acid adenylation domain-containing protein n=1 Tax=Kitasatospora sp. NPDC001603 TaxID=3154388 RepID=UPI00332EC0A6